jgi:hypothetical protein
MSDIQPRSVPDVALIATTLRGCAELLEQGSLDRFGCAPLDLRQQAERLETWAAEMRDVLERTASIVIHYLPPSNLNSPQDAMAEVTTLVDTHPAFKGWQPLSALRAR